MKNKKIETTTSIPINVIFGKEYYLRCSVSKGLIVGRQLLELVDTKYL